MYNRVTHLKTPPVRMADAAGDYSIVALLRYVSALSKRYSKWRAGRKAAKDLMALPDYLLKDIGISRSQIGTATRKRENREHRMAALPLAAFRIRG